MWVVSVLLQVALHARGFRVFSMVGGVVILHGWYGDGIPLLLANIKIIFPPNLHAYWRM